MKNSTLIFLASSLIMALIGLTSCNGPSNVQKVIEGDLDFAK